MLVYYTAGLYQGLEALVYFCSLCELCKNHFLAHTLKKTNHKCHAVVDARGGYVKESIVQARKANKPKIVV